ncbi:MAG: hypothetical protein LIO91_03790 [Bacteroidales bacterium]|nr:hypothetical protein [Bacteroidales bacterium]
MKINFDKRFKTFSGKDTSDKMSDLVCQCLFSYGQKPGATPDSKYTAYKLCNRIMATPAEVELTTEEASLVKDVCGAMLTAGGYGQVYDLIEHPLT